MRIGLMNPATVCLPATAHNTAELSPTEVQSRLEKGKLVHEKHSASSIDFIDSPPDREHLNYLLWRRTNTHKITDELLINFKALKNMCCHHWGVINERHVRGASVHI